MFHLVTPLPFLLDYSFFVPLLLRLTLGIFIFTTGLSYKKNTAAEGSSMTAIMAYQAFFVIIGLALIAGIYTQIAALLIFLLIAASFADKRLLLTDEFTRPTLTLLLIIAISLALSGAGPFAIDFPL